MAPDSLNTNKLKKQLKSLKKDAKEDPAILKAMPVRKKMKIERQEHYKEAKKEADKWIP